MWDKCTLPWIHKSTSSKSFEEGGHSVQLGLVFIRIIQRNRTSRLLIYLLICDDESAHVIMKAEKFHAVSSTNCKPRKASRSIQFQPNSLRSSVPGGANPSLRAKEDQQMCPSSDSGTEEAAITLLLVYLGLLGFGCCSGALGKPAWFAESTIWNTNLIPKQWHT